MYLSQYINYLVKWHGYSHNEAELLIDDLKPTIYWLEQIDNNIFNYLDEVAIDDYTYSQPLNLI